MSLARTMVLLSAASCAGMDEIRTSWGDAQEATALYHAMQLFPHSSMEEIGMLYLKPRALPASWGFEPRWPLSCWCSACCQIHRSAHMLRAAWSGHQELQSFSGGRLSTGWMKGLLRGMHNTLSRASAGPPTWLRKSFLGQYFCRLSSAGGQQHRN